MKRILFSLLLLVPFYAHSQIITTVAGVGTIGYSGDNGIATAAQMSGPVGVVTDNAGNIYIADYNNHRIRMVNTSGVITTIAGTGTGAHSGDNGPATAADLNGPRGIAIDTAGNIYFTEYLSGTLRKVTTTGIITTIAGGGSTYADGVTATATQLYNPVGVAVDRAGNIYLDDYVKSVIRRINTSGIISRFAGVDTAGFSGDGGPATAAKLHEAYGIAVDTTGNVYIADGYYNHRIRKIDIAGTITTIAGTDTGGFSGDGGAATAAKLYAPDGVSIDNNGNIFIADMFNDRVRVIDPSGMINTYAGSGVYGFSGDGGPATAANIGHPNAVFVDNQHNLFIADYNNQRIRKVTPPASTALIADVSANNAISQYPNPARTELHITATEMISSVTVSNLLGQTVYSHQYSSNNVQLDVSSLPAGVYFIKVNGTEVRKFVKE